MTEARRPGARSSPSLEDRALLDDLYSAYLWALDTQDAEIYVSVFWPEASLLEDQLDGSTRRYEPAAEIISYTTQNFSDFVGHQHRESTRLYTPVAGHPDRWRAQSYWFTSDRAADTNEVGFTSTGYYRDVVEKRDGEWRYLSRHIARWPGGQVVHPFRAPE